MVEKPFKDEFKVKATRKALSKGNVRKIQLIVKTNHIANWITYSFFYCPPFSRKNFA